MALHYGEFAEQGIIALYEEAPGGGDFRDINAPRNRPALDPANWLDHIYFHSSLDNMEVLADTLVTVNHAAVAAGSGGSGGASFPSIIQYGGVTATHTLYNHDLGYRPYVLALAGSNVLIGAYPVQTAPDRRMRAVSVIVDEEDVKLYEWTVRTSNALPALSQDYRILVFRRPPAPAGNYLKKIDEAAGVYQLAFGRFDVDRRYLQVVAGGSPWALSAGRSIDLKRGGVRIANPDGTTWDTVPTGYQARLNPPNNGGGVLYYDGTFAGAEVIPVQAP